MANGEGAPSRYGSQGEHVEWRAAIELYERDQVVEARDMALRLGVGASATFTGWYRLFEAEANTRERSEVVRLYDWLELEYVESETPPLSEFEPVLREAVDTIAARLGWHHGPKTRISILRPEADAPWAIGRYGYMTAKANYDKICLPHQALSRPHQLSVTTQHEYAHVIVRNAAEGKAPTWLDEGIAMLAEPNLDPRMTQGLGEGRFDWLGPDDLDRAFRAERRNGENSLRVALAYHQAALIVRYVVRNCDETRLVRLLNGFTNNPNWLELWMNLTGRHHADEALQEVYGIGEIELFERARADLAASHL